MSERRFEPASRAGRLLPQLDALWHIGLVRAPIARFLEPDFVPTIEWLPRAPWHEYYADPFALQTNAGLLVVCEAYDYRTRRGRLIELREQGRGSLQFVRRTLHAPQHHSSFPCLVRDGARTFCIPEQGATGRTCLYQLDLAREHKRVIAEHVLLPDFGATDPVLFHHGELWWLIATDHAALPATHLHVFYAEQLTGPYRAHRHNPVSTDPSRSRCAGLPFEVAGRWYRPVQDATTRYGGALALVELRRCTADAFEEHVVRRIAPADPTYHLGLHTLNAAGPITFVDGLRPSRVPPFLRALSAMVSFGQ